MNGEIKKDYVTKLSDVKKLTTDQPNNIEWTVVSYIDTGLMMNFGTYTDFRMAMGVAMDFLQELVDTAGDSYDERNFSITPLYFLEGGENLGMTMYFRETIKDEFRPDQYIWFLRHEIKGV